MAINMLLPVIQKLSNTDKLLLLQVLVQELLKTEGITEGIDQGSASTAPEKYPVQSDTAPLTLAERQAFLQQPVAERQRVLAEQAAALQNHYEQNTDWQDLMAGDIVEY
ncbi:MAG TPA: hypothetical protein VLS96_03250 [Nodosilinea sp.]|nr:hypothetical protein [Nodosilinea sp.]